MKKRILVLTKYPRMGASSRLRTLQYLPLLEQQGFEFTVQSLFDDAYLNNLYGKGRRSRLAVISCYLKRLCSLLWAWKFDLIWIEKELFPYFPATAERLLAVFGVKYVVDYDDAIFHNYDLSANPLIKRFLAKKIDNVMKYSYHVLVGNAYLAERAKTAGAKNVQLLPTVVDHLRYQNRQAPSEGTLTVGWIGSPSTQKYVVDILPALQAAYHKVPFRLLLVGATGDIRDQLPELNVDVQSWSEEAEVEQIRTMDVGIMPLQDGPWEKGKCGYKLIQYMACGVPVIASPVGVNREIVEGADAGLLASEYSEWQAALLRLLTSSDLRLQQGKAGRVAVEQQYSVQSQLPVIRHVLSGMVE